MNIGDKLVNSLVSLEQRHKSWIGYVFLVSGWLMFTVFATFAKLVQNMGLVQILYFRFMLGVVFNMIVLKLIRVSIYIQNRKQFMQLLLNGTVGFCSFYSYTVAIRNIPLSVASIIFMICTVWVALCGPFLLGEKFTLVNGIAICLCFFGLILITKPSIFFNKNENSQEDNKQVFKNQLLGYFFAFLQSLLLAFQQLFQKYTASKIHNLVTLHYLYSVSAFFYQSFAINYVQFQIASFQEYVAIFLGIFAGCLGQVLYTRSFVLLSVYTITIFSYSETVFMLIFDVIVFGFIPDFLSVVGALIIIGSCLSVALYQFKSQKIQLK